MLSGKDPEVSQHVEKLPMAIFAGTLQLRCAVFGSIGGASSHSKRSQGMTGVWRSRLMLGRVAPSHYRLEHIDQIDSDCKFIWMEHVWKFDGLVRELPRHSYILKHHLFLVHLRYNSHKLQRFVALEARTVGWPQKYWHLNDPHCLGLAKGGEFGTKMEYKQTMLQS